MKLGQYPTFEDNDREGLTKLRVLSEGVAHATHAVGRDWEDDRLEIYVDPVKGNDKTGDLEGKPFKTIAAAVLYFRQFDCLNGVNLRLAEGVYQIDSVLHLYYLKHYLRVIGEGPTKTILRGSPEVNPVIAINSDCAISLENLRVEIQRAGGSCIVARSQATLSDVEARSLSEETRGTGFYFSSASGGVLKDCSAYNVYYGVSGTQTGQISVEDFSGSNVGVAYRASYGRMSVTGSTVDAGTLKREEHGGKIYGI